MKISFKSNSLEKKLSTPKAIQKAYGERAKRVNQRMKELEAASILEIMRTLPAANCHELEGNLKGELAVDISRNWRIIFEVDHDPLPLKVDGGLDWKEVTAIKILEVEDYH